MSTQPLSNIFYSVEEKTLFWLTNTGESSTSNLVEKVQFLYADAQTFASGAGIDISQVKTFEVLKSSQYKYMRCFYVENFTGNVPAEAFNIGGVRSDGTKSDWTMRDWIHN